MTQAFGGQKRHTTGQSHMNRAEKRLLMPGIASRHWHARRKGGWKAFCPPLVRKDTVKRLLGGKHESKAAYDIVSRTGVGLQKILAVRNSTHQANEPVRKDTIGCFHLRPGCSDPLPCFCLCTHKIPPNNKQKTYNQQQHPHLHYNILQSCWLTCLSTVDHRLHQQFQNIGSPYFCLQIPVTCGNVIETPSKTKQMCYTF